MMNFTLRQLRYFLALKQHRHFGRAAAASAISQPALSVQIRDLEEAIGLPLVERTPRDVRLTSFGETFAQRADDIVSAVDELSNLSRAAQGGLFGRLRLGIIPTIAPYLLVRLIKGLAEIRPGVELQVRETTTPNLIEELGNGRIDCAVLALPVSEPHFAEASLFTEEFVLVRPERDHGAPLPDRDKLREMRLLLLEEGHCFRDQALSFCSMPSPVKANSLDASSLSTLVQMVGAGMGVTLLPEMAIPVETRSAPVCISRFTAPTPQRNIGLIWRKKSLLAEQFTDLARDMRGLF